MKWRRVFGWLLIGFAAIVFAVLLAAAEWYFWAHHLDDTAILHCVIAMITVGLLYMLPAMCWEDSIVRWKRTVSLVLRVPLFFLMILGGIAVYVLFWYEEPLLSLVIHGLVLCVVALVAGIGLVRTKEGP